MANTAMDPSQIFWFFFMLSALQPVIKQKWLEATRQRLLARIESKRGSRVILPVHRQETMSALGFPLFRYIDVNDASTAFRRVRPAALPPRSAPSANRMSL